MPIVVVRVPPARGEAALWGHLRLHPTSGLTHGVHGTCKVSDCIAVDQATSGAQQLHQPWDLGRCGDTPGRFRSGSPAGAGGGPCPCPPCAQPWRCARFRIRLTPQGQAPAISEGPADGSAPALGRSTRLRVRSRCSSSRAAIDVHHCQALPFIPRATPYSIERAIHVRSRCSGCACHRAAMHLCRDLCLPSLWHRVPTTAGSRSPAKSR